LAAININDLKEHFEFIANKEQAGAYASPEEISRAAKHAQNEVIRTNYARWQNSQQATDIIGALLQPTTLVIDANGQANYPSDYLHTSSVRYHYTKQIKKGDVQERDVEVRAYTNAEWGKALESNIVKPEKRRPGLTFYDTYIQFEPKALGKVTLDYLRTPPDPLWGYTLVDGREVYAETGGVTGDSVNLLLDENTIEEVVGSMLSYMGIRIREGSLAQYGEMYKQAT